VSVLLSHLDALAHQLGLPADSPLLGVALTHSSYAAEQGVESNERLEFLGDAVVDLVIADAIITQYPDLDQGTGSLVRSKVVNEAALATVARELGVGELVRLGKGEAKSHGAERPALLADAFEAVVAAVYVERGFAVARAFVLAHLGETLAAAAASPEDVDPKSRLRHWSEHHGHGVPHYEVSGEGPSHATQFVATVYVNGHALGTGEGRSKKAAEAAAARAAWDARRA
jgi:ribonuclease III